MLWIKAFHIIFMVTWFAGLFYLPRLFVYHAMSEDPATTGQFKIMERKLYFGIATPGGILTIGFGLWLWLGYGIGDNSGWLWAKLAAWCGTSRRTGIHAATCFFDGSTNSRYSCWSPQSSSWCSNPSDMQ